LSVDLNGEERRLRLIPTGTKIRYRQTEETQFIAIHFNLTFLHGKDLFSGICRQLLLDDAELRSRLIAQTESEQDSIRDICRLNAVVWEIIARFLPDLGPENQDKLAAYAGTFRFIREHLDARLGVAQLAEAVGKRPDVFSREFKRDFGISPLKYLHRELVGQIALRLLDRRTPLKEIAANLNFSSEFNLSSFYKRETGHSPRKSGK